MTDTILLLRQAAEWRMLSLLFECPTPQWRERLRMLAKDVQDATLRAAAENAIAEAAEGDYHSIFGPGGPAPAREVSYHDTLQLGYLVSELTSFYDAFSFKPITEEALDHISVEAGFVGYLRIKEAFAQTNENAEQAAIAAEASTGFVNDHLSYIAQPLAASLAESGVSYLASAGAALLSRVGPCRTLPVLPDLTGEALCTDSTFDCGVSLS